MSEVPLYVSLTFGITVLATIAIFHYALSQAFGARRAAMVSGAVIVWSIIQSVLAYRGFYLEQLDQLPPRFPLIFVPTLFVIILLLSFKKGRAWMDRFSLVPLTYLSTVRIVVEIVLYWLFLYQTIPELMTFSGRNFDILAGLTAPLVAYFGLQRLVLRRRFLLVWNLVAFGLLWFIIINAILSTPTPVQQFAFDQPNIAIFYFPFVLLPATVVPIVLFAHVVSLRQLYTGLPLS